MKIGILGSEGFLGSKLYDFFKVNYNVLGITRTNYVPNKGKKFDIFINANGNSKRYWANNNVIDDFESSTTSVYKTLFDFKIKYYIFISSVDVYESHSDPLKTNEGININPLNLSAYGFHKYLSEMLIKKYTHNYLILRCAAIIGDNMKKGPLKDLLNNKPMFVTLNSELQYITTSEIANIIVKLTSNNINNEIFNIGGVGSVSFDYLSKILKKEPLIHKEAETQVYEMNIGKLKSMFPLKRSEDYIDEYLNLKGRE